MRCRIGVAREHYDEALRIMEGKYGLSSEEAFLCRKNQQQLYTKGTSDCNEIMAKIVEFCPVKDEIKAAVKWWANHLRGTPNNDVGNKKLNKMMDLTSPA